MSNKPPTPPSGLPTEVVNTLNDYFPDQLQQVARYAEKLAEHKTRETSFEQETADDEIDELSDDLPDGVPSKASITIKKINGNHYYYWQWRDGDQIRSQYRGPVDSKSEGN